MIKTLVDEHLACEKEQRKLRAALAELYEKDQNHKSQIIQVLNAQFTFIELFPFLTEDDVTTLCKTYNVTKTLSYADNDIDISVCITATELHINEWSEAIDVPGVKAWCWKLIEVEDKLQEIKDVIEIVMKDRLAFVETALKHFGSLK